MTLTQNQPHLVDKQSVAFARVLPSPLETVWEAIATRAGLSRWLMDPAQEPAAGGRFSFEGGWDGHISAFDPPHVIEFTPVNSAGAYLRFELSPTDNATLFRLVDRMGDGKVAVELVPDSPVHQIYQPGGAGTHWSGILAGYQGFIDELETVLTGKQFEFDYDGLCRDYTALLDAWFGKTLP